MGEKMKWFSIMIVGIAASIAVGSSLHAFASVMGNNACIEKTQRAIEVSNEAVNKIVEVQRAMVESHMHDARVAKVVKEKEAQRQRQIQIERNSRIPFKNF